MSQYNYIVKPRAQQKVYSFYHNVARKYKHTYDFDDFMRNVRSAIDSMSFYYYLAGRQLGCFLDYKKGEELRAEVKKKKGK